MAKKRIEQPVYPVAPLKISREKFCSLLKGQIAKGRKLIEIDVPVLQQYSSYSGFGFTSSGREKVVYQEDSERAFTEDYRRWNDRNIEIYRSSFTEPKSMYYYEYEQLIGHIWGSNTVKEYKDKIKLLSNHMQGDIERVDLMECIIDASTNTSSLIVPDDVTKTITNDIFIVHGHNEEMKQAVARTVSKLGCNPIILHEQVNEGRTIISKFEANAERVHFAIILLSGDDYAASVFDVERIKETDIRALLEKRARQNVVFEMGYFYGKLGPSNMFFLLQDNVSKPGDLDGLVYTPYDAGGLWKFTLVKELKACGYSVDANSLL